MGNNISVQFLVFCMLNDFRFTCALLGIESIAYQHLFGVHSWAPSCLWPPHTFFFLGAPLFHFSWRAGILVIVLCNALLKYATCPAKQWRTSKMNSRGGWAYPLGNTTPQLNVVEGSSAQSFGYCGLPYATELLRPWQNRKKTRHGYNRRFPHSLWTAWFTFLLLKPVL